jgi:hypothetical protein
MKKNMLDLYSDYLISSFGAATATGLSQLLDGAISHDEVTQWLAYKARTSAEFWLKVKPYVREIESEEGVLILDDSIEEKPYTDENEQICWHYDHCKDRQVKGINFLTSLYSNQDIGLPVGYQLITKTEYYVDKKTGKTNRRSEKGKNEYFRELVAQAVRNQIQFHYVLNDSWFASAENMSYIKQEQDKDFIMPLKVNRKIAFSKKDKAQGKYVRLETVDLEENSKREIYLEGVEFPLSLIKQVFVNEDDSIGVLYLVTSDLKITYKQITTIYRKRWKVEEYHKSLKQNVSLSKSPTKTVDSQANHFFASLWGYVKLEVLKLNSKLNHFALKSKLYIKALQQSYSEWQSLKPF